MGNLTEDFVAALGPIAMGSRLKRLSDRLLSDAADILDTAGLPLLPTQVALLAALERHGPMTIGAAADGLGVSQPAATRTVANLMERGLIDSAAAAEDGRVRLLSLTATGSEVIARTRREIWPRLAQVVSALCDGREHELLTLMTSLEVRMSEQSMAERFNAAVQILPWAPERARAFHDINIAWIEQMFAVEAHDRDVLEDPQKFIIDRGGDILFAALPDLGIVGACALMPTDDGAVELTKMGVFESARGRKVGEALLAAVLERARAFDGRTLFLLTNHKCAPAIHLYQKLGFRHDGEIMARYGASYERCDVAMRFGPA
ncbi:MAG: bifunctional helix-turn-helix transcriptional regulator/GNAT family N-acetyltransferase [Caulobacterales bacterium]|jgi:DNA-binding MarR family transcriptional regulator/GNAT superfamily N-acetyltransferase